MTVEVIVGDGVFGALSERFWLLPQLEINTRPNTATAKNEMSLVDSFIFFPFNIQ